MGGFVIALLLLRPGSFSQAIGQSSPTSHLPPPTLSYTPHRVYDTHHKQFIDFEAFVSGLTGADLVFVGEEHDDPATHRMELALLEGIARQRDSVVLALEMFERDVQPLLNRYLTGAVPEDSLLAHGRPWKNYRTDYRPLIELARGRSWPVLASNVPRPMASLVARAGLSALDTLSAEARRNGAERLGCPEDSYYDRFVKSMGDLSAHGPPSPPPANGPTESPKARIGRLYEAQCLKDETMGESVAAAWRPGRLIVHYNGSFHSDFREGTVTRAERRLRQAGGRKVLVVTAVPVADLDLLKPDKKDRKRADYLLYVLGPAKPDSAKR